MNTATPIFRRILIYGSILAVGIGVVGAILGGIFVGSSGVVSALVGTALAVVFMLVTAVTILVANKYATGATKIGAYFGIIMLGWLAKFILFIVLVLVLREQPWVHPTVLLLAIIAGVVGSLVVDLVVIAKSRLPHASDVTLPESGSESAPDAGNEV